MFQDPAPSRDDLNELLATALQDDRVPVYFDTSVLLHCYELSAAARDDLLEAIEALGSKIRIPLWVAHEVFAKVQSRNFENPLKKPRTALLKQLDAFKGLAYQSIDDDEAPEQTADEFFGKLDELKGDFTRLTGPLVSRRRDADRTTSLLMPLINARVLSSDINPLIERAVREGEIRFSHGLPPGPGDGAGAMGTGGDVETSRDKGKVKNRFGDLIIWWEVLNDVLRADARAFVIVTRDVSKGDMVYVPRHLTDAAGSLVQNTVLTLPHPMLVAEAKSVTGVENVHVVSLDHYALSMTNLGLDLTNLLRAIQRLPENAAPSDPDENKPQISRSLGLVEDGADEEEYRNFTGRDLSYALDEGNSIDRLIGQLRSEDWQVIGRAFAREDYIVAGATREQMLHLGGALAEAANAGVQVAQRELSRLILGESDAEDGWALRLTHRRNLLLGVLATVYIAREGTAAKPVAMNALSSIFFSASGNPDYAVVFTDVMTRLASVREFYLRLPDEGRAPVAITLLSDRSTDGGAPILLQAVTTDGTELLEADAPRTRQLVRVGDDLIFTLEDLRRRVADEFAVPFELLEFGDTPSRFTVPRGLGFRKWGPGTGIALRDRT